MPASVAHTASVPHTDPRDHVRELAGEMYLAPECAELLMLRATDPTAPEMARRCSQALAWLDPDDPLPLTMRRGESATERITLALATLLTSVFTGAGRQDRSRVAGLLRAVLSEAARITGAAGRMAA